MKMIKNSSTTLEPKLVMPQEFLSQLFQRDQLPGRMLVLDLQLQRKLIRHLDLFTMKTNTLNKRPHTKVRLMKVLVEAEKNLLRLWKRL